jgi:hypothetical protein
MLSNSCSTAPLEPQHYLDICPVNQNDTLSHATALRNALLVVEIVEIHVKGGSDRTIAHMDIGLNLRMLFLTLPLTTPVLAQVSHAPGARVPLDAFA